MEPLVDPSDFPASVGSAYLNAASVALMYHGAATAAVEWQEELAREGTISFDEAAEQTVFEDLHRASARLLNASPDDIAVGSSATELLGSLAWAIAPGADTNVVSADVEFPSTLYPWARVSRHTGSEIRLARGSRGYIDLEELRRLIDDRTAVVCVSHVEYGSGQMYDLQELAEAAHAHGALLVADATQSAGAVPIDVGESGVDALVSAGYKWLCGTFGAAVMYVAPQLQPTLDPGLVGFRSHRDMWDLQADRVQLSDSARRFEFSTTAYGCAIALARAIEYLLDVGVERIFDYNLGLAAMLVGGLEERGAEIVSPQNERERTSIVAARFPGKDSAELAAHLNAARVVVSPRGDLVRFSPHLYNTLEDIERALQEIDRFLG